MNRATCWSVTINNPTAADEEEIAVARQKGWKVEGQLEQGENGTPHYQLMVNTPQVRFSAVKKSFARGHIEIARNQAALKQYVVKEDTKVADLNIQQNKYPSLSKFWILIYDKLTILLKGQDPVTDIEWKKLQDSKVLSWLDQATEELIYEGYYVETLAVNPQTRSAFLKFSRAILSRALADKDRQTDTQCVTVPTIIADEKSINDEGEGRDDESDDNSRGSEQESASDFAEEGEDDDYDDDECVSEESDEPDE